MQYLSLHLTRKIFELYTKGALAEGAFEGGGVFKQTEGQPNGPSLLDLESVFQLTVKGLRLHVAGVGELGVHTAQPTVEGLGLDGGVGGDIQLFRPSGPGPIRCGGEEGPAGAGAPQLLGHMDAGQVQIPVLAALREAQ